MVEVDFQEFAVGLDVMREVLRAMIAGLVEDGFSDEQARQLVVAVFTRKIDDDEEEMS